MSDSEISRTKNNCRLEWQFFHWKIEQARWSAR